MLRRFGAIGITLSILAAATPVAQELDRVAVIISQPTSPVEIYDFSRTDRSGRFTTTGDELYVNARWRNIVDRLIVAVEIGVLDFDVWHEFLEYQLINNFEKLEPRDDNRLNYSFTQHGTKYQITRIQTSFAYVSRVMFEDGEIWERSLEQVTEEVQKQNLIRHSSTKTICADGEAWCCLNPYRWLAGSARRFTRVRGVPVAGVQTGQAQHIVDTVNLLLGLS